MGSEQGLRERKKLQTRQLIADASWALFSERGFDRVTVAEVARRADVSEATVFNYFPTKEDLVYHRMEAFEEELLDAVRGRSPGESVVAAFGGFVLAPRGALASNDPAAVERLAAVTRVITGSPALLAREREIFERFTSSLAGLIAEDAGMQRDAVEPWVAANALLGVHRAMLDHVRRRALAGVPAKRIAREVRTRGERALALLERGLSEIDPGARAAR